MALGDTYISKDRYGRPIGFKGESAKDEEELQVLKEQEKATMISDYIDIATTLYGGFNMASAIKESGFKEFLKQSINPLEGITGEGGLVEKVKLFAENPREGLASLLPDLRPEGERWGISPQFSDYFSGLDTAGKSSMKDQVLGLFDEEQLSRLNASEMLSIFDDM